MKLVMTLLVRDEADIVRENIDFHLNRGIDGVVAIDNGSTDGTLEILEDFSRQRVLKILHEPGRDYAQSRWVTRAAEYARETMGADWLLNNDADEFWTTPTGNLKDAIGETGANVLHCKRVNMIAAYETLRGDWAGELVYRVADPVAPRRIKNFYVDPLPCPYFYFDLPSKALVRARGLVSVAQGNHDATFGETTTPPEQAAVEILHFPVRSMEQFRKKIVQGGEAYRANTELAPRMGWHWRRWYKMFLEQGIEAALADSLPSRDQLEADLQSGVVLEDRRFARLAKQMTDTVRG